jgi:hypothetical protein
VISAKSIFFFTFEAPGGRFDPFRMSGAARGASDVIGVIRGDSGTPGAGHRRSQRKRVKTTRAMESMQQENDMDWEEENSSERMPRNHKNRTTRVGAADEANEETRGPEQAVDHDFNKLQQQIGHQGRSSASIQKA